jgi:integrase
LSVGSKTNKPKEGSYIVSLLKRGNVWWSYFYLDGIRHQYSTGATNRRQAETIEARLKEEANNRRFQVVQADPHMTFAALAARFLAGGTARPHHIYHLKFLLPFFGETPVLRLTKPMAEEFRNRRKREKAGTPIKDATVNRDLSVLRHILYWAVDEQLLEGNPLARLKMARERRTKRQVLSLAEEQRLLPAASPHLRAMIITALDTGMRRGEITSQRWEDVDLDRGLLYVTRSKTPDGEAREIPLTKRLFALLSESRKDEGIVFDYQGQQVRILKTAWKTALKKGGVRHVRFHDLRHTFNTRLMEAGVLQEIRMALMGHSAGSKVHATYTHIELPAKREAIRKLEAWVNWQQQEQLKKEQNDVRTETTGIESNRSETGSGESRSPETVEEEDAR